VRLFCRSRSPTPARTPQGGRDLCEAAVREAGAKLTHDDAFGFSPLTLVELLTDAEQRSQTAPVTAAHFSPICSSDSPRCGAVRMANEDEARARVAGDWRGQHR
jgi:hypothetical protein